MRDLGTRTYGDINKAQMDAILDALTVNGAVITGKNPWLVDTKNHGVLLKGEWDEAASCLAITVTDAEWYVPRSAVWENIDSLMSRVNDV